MWGASLNRDQLKRRCVPFPYPFPWDWYIYTYHAFMNGGCFFYGNFIGSVNIPTTRPHGWAGHGGHGFWCYVNCWVWLTGEWQQRLPRGSLGVPKRSRSRWSSRDLLLGHEWKRADDRDDFEDEKVKSRKKSQEETLHNKKMLESVVVGG